MPVKRILVCLFMFFSLAGMPTVSRAHGVYLFAHMEAGQIVGEGYYAGGRPVKESPVEIYISDGDKLLATIQTDAEGQFVYPVAQAGSYKLVLLAGQGHQAEFVIDADEIASTKQPTAGSTAKSIVLGLACIAGIFVFIFILKRKFGHLLR